MKVIVVVCDEQCQSVNCFCLAGRFGYSYQLSHGTLARPSLSSHSLFGFPLFLTSQGQEKLVC